jgi:hypothetical protein
MSLYRSIFFDDGTLFWCLCWRYSNRIYIEDPHFWLLLYMHRIRQHCLFLIVELYLQ